MFPEDGINAICPPVALHCTPSASESKAIRFIAEAIGEDPYAIGIFGECADEPSGKLKFNIGKIDLDKVEQISIDSPSRSLYLKMRSYRS